MSANVQCSAPHPEMLWKLNTSCSLRLNVALVVFPGVPGQLQPSPLKRSMSLIPSSGPACGSEWLSPSDEQQGQGQQGSRQGTAGPDHAPLSPQSSVASSGSEQTEEQGSTRNTFQEDGSGMKGKGDLMDTTKRDDTKYMKVCASVANNTRSSCVERTCVVLCVYLR